MRRRIIQLIPYPINIGNNGGVLRSTNILCSFAEFDIYRITYDSEQLYVNEDSIKISPVALACEKFLLKLFGYRNNNIVDLLSLVWLKKFGLNKTDILIIENLCYRHSAKFGMKKDLFLVYNSHNFDLNYAVINGVDVSKERINLLNISRYTKTAIICCSNREKKEYMNFVSKSKICVVPNGTHRNVRDNKILGSITDLDFYFIGDLRTVANKEAVEFLIDFWEAHKIANRLFVIGQLSELFDKKVINVHFLGVLSDIELKNFFLETKALIVPLWKGEGTRLKIIEAFEQCNYVISTAKGIEGFDFTEDPYFAFSN